MAQMLAGARPGPVEFSLFDPACYENAADKAAAIVEILNTKDFDAFLEASGYPEREAFSEGKERSPSTRAHCAGFSSPVQ